MTSNERKIIKCLRETKGEVRIQSIARQTGFSRDYTRMLGHSLKRAGYIKFADTNSCCLLAKGCACFQDNVYAEASISYPFQKNEETELEQKEPEIKLIAEASDEPSQESTEEKIGNGVTPTATLNALNGASEKEKEKLAEAGYKSVEEVAEAPISKLIQSLGVSLKKAASWINQARRETGIIQDGKHKNE